MASLQNCLPVQKYEAEEFAGDGVLNGLLEQQAPPVGNTFPQQTASPSLYWLVIEPMPGFNIQANMINIGGVNGILPTGTSNTWMWTTTTVPANNSTLPAELDQAAGVRAMNSNVDNPSSCDNKVIVRVGLDIAFVMPTNDVTIGIDFGGTAAQCEVELPDNWPYALIVNNLHVTNFDINIGYDIHVAKYFDTEAEALNPHDRGNQQFPSDSFTNNAPPTYDPNGDYNALYPSNWTDGSLQSFQPCAYNFYVNRKLYNYLGPDAATATGFTYGTICNDEFNINLPQGYQSSGDATQNCTNGNNAVYQAFISHPNEDPSCMFDARADKWQYIYESDTNSNPAYPSATLSSIDYPQLTPGDGKLPSKYVYYITLSNNFTDDWELIADYDFVKVYKIYSVTGIYLQCENGNPTNALVSEKNIDTGALISNNSILDINSVELFQVDSKTVKVTIPFQSDFVWNLWDTQSNTEGIRTYIEINANYIGQ